MLRMYHSRRVPARWESIEAVYDATIRELLPRRVDPSTPWFGPALQFELQRLGEGRQIGAFFLAKGIRGRVLDVGAGTGGVCFGIASHDELRSVWLDFQANSETRIMRERTGLDVVEVAGTGEALPFDDECFDAVVCVETIEHVHDPRALGREVMRVLKPGGACMITTPPRLRFLFRRDPHYGIRGLLLLPDALQRFVGERALPRKDMYDVEHIFGHVESIARCFPGPKRVETLWNASPHGRWWFPLRHFLWDRIVIWKWPSRMAA